jgi:hypothetical protein
MWDKAIVAGLAWFITIYKFNAMRRDGQWRTGSVTFYYWLFSLSFAIAFTFMFWPVARGLDWLTGLPNLSWLMTYLAFVFAGYCNNAACYLLLKLPRSPILFWSYWATMLALIAIYILGVVVLPQKLDHTVPEYWAELLFMETLYLYVAIFCFIPLFTFSRLFWSEQIVSARLRWFVGIVSSLTAAAVVTCKIVLTVVAFRNPETTAVAMVAPFMTVGVIVVGVFFPLGFVPNRWYQTAARPLEFVGKGLALIELQLLRHRLDELCPPVLEQRRSWREMVGDLDFYLYRAMIAIVDAKQTLAGYASITNDLTIQPVLVAYKAGKIPPEWSADMLHQAQWLHHTLQKVEDGEEYTHLIQAYRRISRSVVWQLRPLSAVAQQRRAHDLVY